MKCRELFQPAQLTVSLDHRI